MGSTLSELRKEIAHKLAAIGSSFEMQQEQQIYTPMGFLAFVTLDDAKAEPIEVMAALSDLIDPTCKMTVKSGHACCGNCGHRLSDEREVEEDYYEFRPYCPDCGAMVVSEDE